MATNPDDYLPLSGIQHFCFCRRQWALIHLEQQWAENLRTAQGRLQHARCHDDTYSESRGNLRIVRGMRVASQTLRLNGVCDVVEFRADPNGIEIQGWSGTWHPSPGQNKPGVPKHHDADRLQLCAQAMALEEMLVCTIPRGALYYAGTRRREAVELTAELRLKTQTMADEMHELYARGYTPKTRPGKHCNACSLKELCLPALCRRGDVSGYIRTHLEEAQRGGET